MSLPLLMLLVGLSKQQSLLFDNPNCPDKNVRCVLENILARQDSTLRKPDDPASRFFSNAGCDEILHFHPDTQGQAPDWAEEARRMVNKMLKDDGIGGNEVVNSELMIRQRPTNQRPTNQTKFDIILGLIDPLKPNTVSNKGIDRVVVFKKEEVAKAAVRLMEENFVLAETNQMTCPGPDTQKSWQSRFAPKQQNETQGRHIS